MLTILIKRSICMSVGFNFSQIVNYFLGIFRKIFFFCKVLFLTMICLVLPILDLNDTFVVNTVILIEPYLVNSFWIILYDFLKSTSSMTPTILYDVCMMSYTWPFRLDFCKILSLWVNLFFFFIFGVQGAFNGSL